MLSLNNAVINHIFFLAQIQPQGLNHFLDFSCTVNKNKSQFNSIDILAGEVDKLNLFRQILNKY